MNARVSMLALLCLAAFAQARAEDYDWGAGPYLSQVAPDGITINWLTVEKTAATVRYGLSADALDAVAEDAQVRQKHEVRLTGLRAGTRYHYQAISGDFRSETFSFATAKPKGEAFSFIVYGDTRSDAKTHAKVVELVDELDGDFLIQTGDMISDGRQSSHWKTFFDIEQPLLARKALYPVLGNHEKHSDHYFTLFSLPGNEAFYSFDYSNAHFIMLDSDRFPLVPSRTHEQFRFLKEDIERSDADFVFAVWHHPSWGSHKSRKFDHIRVRAMTQQLLKDAGVDVVFFGHDHHYVHSQADGIHFVVVGGGGAPLYDLDNPGEQVVKQLKDYHACKIAIDGKKLSFEAYDLKREVFDRFSLDKSGAPSPPQAPKTDEEF